MNLRQLLQKFTEQWQSQTKESRQNRKDVTQKTSSRRGFKLKRRSLYLLLALGSFIYYYFVLPPLHYASYDFWLFLFLISAAWLIIEVIYLGTQSVQERSYRDFFQQLAKPTKGLLYFWLAVVVVMGVGYAVTTPLFLSKQYASMIDVQTKVFEEDFPLADPKQIPLVDRETATRLGNRHLGALSELVSQFVVAPDYTQININGYPYRVSPLEYADIFRWFNNHREGIPYYMKVDMVSGEVTMEEPPQAIKYSDADYFFRNAKRRLRFSHPLSIFDRPSFEVDDEGNPYYIATTYRRHFFMREPEASGLITLNTMTGETTRYDLDEVPEWVDRVHSAELVMHQLKQRGYYQGGFWNSLLGQKGVNIPTEGYNYLPMEDDIYLYTGMTSVVSDESNIGFSLVNLRTKEASFYPLSAADEISAMGSAEGSIQEKGYTATFPLLINLEGRPMYILSLKDGAGLIKQYALVDVQNYQKVYTAATIDQLMLDYQQDAAIDLTEVDDEASYEELEGRIDAIQAVVVSGETVYYFMVEGDVYRAPVTINDRLPFLEEETEIKFEANHHHQVRSIEWND